MSACAGMVFDRCAPRPRIQTRRPASLAESLVRRAERVIHADRKTLVPRVNGNGGFNFGYAIGISSCNCPLSETENHF